MSGKIIQGNCSTLGSSIDNVSPEAYGRAIRMYLVVSRALLSALHGHVCIVVLASFCVCVFFLGVEGFGGHERS